jgi:hypothetical protein
MEYFYGRVDRVHRHRFMGPYNSLNSSRSSADVWFISIEANRYLYDLIWA